jgi:beta-glucanase (GH16 family)
MSGSLYESFDNGAGALGNVYNVDFSTPGEVRLGGNSAMMEWANGRSAGHGYGTYTVEAKLDGNQPGPAIIFWPGDNQWPGQELDLAEITPDGSGRQYGTVHWNNNGSDAYNAQVYDGVSGGVFHDYTMVWEPGKITYLVDGQVKATFTDNIPVDFANGGMNNTIGFLNNNPNTSITVRDVSYTPSGASAPAPSAPSPAPAMVDNSNDDADDVSNDDGADDWTPAPVAAPAPVTSPSTGSASDPWAQFADASGNINWEAAAAHVTENYQETGYWFV